MLRLRRQQQVEDVRQKNVTSWSTPRTIRHGGQREESLRRRRCRRIHRQQRLQQQQRLWWWWLGGCALLQDRRCPEHQHRIPEQRARRRLVTVAAAQCTKLMRRVAPPKDNDTDSDHSLLVSARLRPYTCSVIPLNENESSR